MLSEHALARSVGLGTRAKTNVRPMAQLRVRRSSRNAALARCADAFSHRIRLVSSGRIQCVLLDAADTVPHDCEIVGMEELRAAHPAFAMFGSTPWTFARKHFSFDTWMLAGGGRDFWDQLTRTAGIAALPLGYSRSAHVLRSDRSLYRYASLAGLTVATHGLALDVVTALGGTAVDAPMPFIDDRQLANFNLHETAEPSLAATDGRRLRYRVTDAFLNRGYNSALLFNPSERHVWRLHLGAIVRAIETQHADATFASETEVTPKDAETTSWSPVVARAISRVSEAIMAELAGADRLSRQIDLSQRECVTLMPQIA